ncbi:espin isoform X2 [Diorhabda carinulata]|uniref:espin isoform X2 n=1 Tax=Diorhabda carinulata TaxID=1163345 RepID=UPI0025A1BB68|nr:espin isoform X2 [Diorhabda carinulata]
MCILKLLRLHVTQKRRKRETGIFFRSNQYGNTDWSYFDFPEFAFNDAGNETLSTSLIDSMCSDFNFRGNVCDCEEFHLKLKETEQRYGRLNVLRWLLWEAESREEMPALEKVAATNTTLALHYAAARGCLDCVRLLVDSSPELSANTQMDNDVTPVYLAAQEGHLEVLKFLVLEAGGSLYVRAKDGMAPIHAASQMGCLNCVKWMIQDQNVDPNLRDGDGATPLHFAASRGHLDTVRWLLKHGAKLSLDKFGKSPINDAAENQQVECLNVLVQHGTAPDYHNSIEKSSIGKGCSCTRKGDKLRRGNSVASDCSNCKPKSNAAKHSNSEPFYLHPPLSDRSIEPAHAPENGLYINPMSKHRHSASSSSESSASGESFYLHNPQEVIYNRVKDLFETTQRQQVKVEVHSSSSGAGSDENLSSSDLSERSGDNEHDYEDIYTIREETKETNKTRSRSRDSGSHSRSASLTSSHSGGLVVLAADKNNNDEDKIEGTEIPEEEPEKTKLAQRHSLPTKSDNGKILKRVTSVPLEARPPPPPPPPPKASRPETEDEPRGAEIVEIIEEPTLKPSDILKGMCRSMSALSARRLNSSCSDLTIVSLDGDEADKHAPNLVNKQRVLPFVPPSFPGSSNSNNLIKPSEYLKSICDKRSSSSRSMRSLSESEDAECSKFEDKKDTNRSAGPPPPPLPDLQPREEANAEMVKKQNQPLSAISIQDLNSVQLRRTEKVAASKTFSAPTRSVSLQCLQSEPFLAQKTDLIAELKMSKDITGIKKMKIEKAKCEESKEKEIFSEITRQLTTTKFVEKVPEKDNTGNIIPEWKRQMLAKKAAEKARKELEEKLLRDAEEKRLRAIPQWKRQLLQKKEEAESKMRSTLYTPKVVDESRISKKLDLDNNNTTSNDRTTEDNGYDDVNNDESIKFENENNETEEQSEEDTPNIIPWRAHLRKTNSKLNLLE